jgi:hypothetical protein
MELSRREFLAAGVVTIAAGVGLGAVSARNRMPERAAVPATAVCPSGTGLSYGAITERENDRTQQTPGARRRIASEPVRRGARQ